MSFQIAQILEEMPKGRVRRPKTDKYEELKELLGQVPQGKVAQIPMEKAAYRAFSAGLRAAGVRTEKKAASTYKAGSAFVSWVPLTEENRPKQRGVRRRQEQAAPALAPIATQEAASAPKRPGRPRRTAATA